LRRKDVTTAESKQKCVHMCKNKGIKINITMSHAPQLNSSAGHHNKTLLKKVKALLFDSEMKKKI